MPNELDPAQLCTRLAQLEHRIGDLETHGRATAPPIHRAAPTDAAADPDRLWALEGLKSRISGSAVLFTGTVALPTKANYEWQQGVDVDALLDADWSLASDVLAALGHPVRLLVLREVLRGVNTVADLGAVDGFATSGQLYHHLRQLIAAGWLRAAGRGHYEVPAARVVPLLVALAAAQR